MCIILTCEKNVRPDHELLESCFLRNPDGAGIMWCEDGRVQTSKGYMSLGELVQAIDCVPMDSRLVIHMRIATSGGIDVGTCHPFPVCTDLDILHAADVECSAAVAHNGVIPTMPTDEKKGISDTVSFVSLVVADLYHEYGRVTTDMCRRIRNAAPGNRFAIMTSDGEVHRMGTGWESVTTGIEASNSTWRRPKVVRLDDLWGEAYDEEVVYDAEYEHLFDFMCGDCECRAECMAYGPYCDDIADAVDWLLDHGQMAATA